MKCIGIINRRFSALWLIFMALTGPLGAQQTGGDMRHPLRNMPYNGMQQMNQQNMQMSMDQMMKQMNEMLSHTGEMVKTIRDQDDNPHEHMQGSLSGLARTQMATMSRYLNETAGGMQRTLAEMQKMMADEKLMNNPLLKKHMGEMRENMGRMMSAMNGLIKNMDKIHSKKQKE